MIGRSLAHFQVLEKLGEGGMGEVYRASDSKLGRDVAIKVLPDAFAEDEERLKRFQREAKVLASLNHPNIAAIYGLEESGGTHYLVLELVPGETLAERIARGPIPYDEAKEIAIKIAEALEEAHDRGIIHRDLKPANVKLTPDGKVKVLDFGLAKAFAEETGDIDSSLSPTITRDATRIGVILGTAAYMSPEQAKGKAVDRRSDIFAFGAVLYEMLTGNKAFPGDDVSEVLAAVLKLEPDWSALPTNVPRRASEILHRCLAKDPRRRLHHIADARIELEEHAESVSATEATPSRSAWATRTTGAIAAGVAAFAFAAGWLWPRATVAPKVERFAIPVDPSISMTFIEPAVSPDGDDVVFSVQSAEMGSQLYRRSRGGFDIVPLEGTEGAWAPFFSPDGQWLGFFTSDHLRKMRWPPQGSSIVVAELTEAFGDGGTWGGDDTIVYADGGGLWRIGAAGGAPTRVTSPDEGQQHRLPQLLPDGRSVLFNDGPAPGNDGVWSAAVTTLENGAWRTVTNGSRSRYVSTGHLVYLLDRDLWAQPFDPEAGQTTGDPVQMVDSVLRFAVSRDGTLVYREAGSEVQTRRLVWVDRDGRETTALAESGAFLRPRLSPDGRRLAVEINEDGPFDNLWVYDLERGTRTRITFEEANTDPVWHPDGEHLTFTHGPGNDEDIATRRADGTGNLDTLVSRERSQNPHSWSSDGRTLAFYERTSDPMGRDLWVLDRDAHEPEPFLVTEFNERSPSFSPDGRFIAYTSDESGEDEIYILSYPGRDSKTTVSRGGGREPVWSRDGRELFYRSRGQVWAVPVRPGEALTVGEPELLFEGPYDGGTGVRGSQTYDVAPDGERFLMVRADESAGPGRLVVVLNWTEELKRLAPVE